jgi:hypothetical protein
MEKVSEQMDTEYTSGNGHSSNGEMLRKFGSQKARKEFFRNCKFRKFSGSSDRFGSWKNQKSERDVDFSNFSLKVNRRS